MHLYLYYKHTKTDRSSDILRQVKTSSLALYESGSGQATAGDRRRPSKAAGATAATAGERRWAIDGGQASERAAVGKRRRRPKAAHYGASGGGANR